MSRLPVLVHRYNFAQLHKKLWLAKANCDKKTVDDILLKLPEEVENDCFACEAAKLATGKDLFPQNCAACPLDWPEPKPPTVPYQRRRGYCHQLFIDYFHPYRVEVAETIANLRWLGPRYFTYQSNKWQRWSLKGGPK